MNNFDYESDSDDEKAKPSTNSNRTKKDVDSESDSSDEGNKVNKENVAKPPPKKIVGLLTAVVCFREPRRSGKRNSTLKR